MKIEPDVHSRRADLHTTRFAIVLLAGLSASLVIPAAARADLTIDITQSGGNVVATATGTIDVSSLRFDGNESIGVFMDPGAAWFITSPESVPTMSVYSAITGPTSWGSGTAVNPTTAIGDTFGFYGAVGYFYLPYGAGTVESISSTDTWMGATFTSLGLDPGTYKYTWGSGTPGESITVQIGPTASAVPEPATIWFAAIGAAAFGLHARFTRSKKQRREGRPGPSRAAE